MFFFDEGRFGLKPNLGRHWARRGHRPVSVVQPGYQNFYLYSAVAPHTGEVFTLFLPWVNTEMMNLYLRELAAAYADSEILIIWDQAGWHCSKGLRLPENIRCEVLPPYSPELNPTERLWQWLRRHATRNRTFDNEQALMDHLAETLRELVPARIASLCRVSYL